MEVMREGKNFVIIKEEELPDILRVLEELLPHSIKFHQTIKTYLNDRIWQFHFYRAKTWPVDPLCLHFPGCTLTPYEKMYESVGIFCPPDRLDRMSLVRDEDILFDWSNPICMNFTHVGIMHKMDEIFRDKVQGCLEGHIYGDIYVHECQSELELELEPLAVEEVSMKPLALDDMKDIHDLYPARDIESLELFERLVDQLPGFGVFNQSDNELAAWSLQSYYGGMFSMQTKPKFRRKGYGIQLAQSLTKLVKKRGYLPFVVIRPENSASRGLYTKLGFRKAFETVRGTFVPYVYDGDAGRTAADGAPDAVELEELKEKEEPSAELENMHEKQVADCEQPILEKIEC